MLRRREPDAAADLSADQRPDRARRRLAVPGAAASSARPGSALIVLTHSHSITPTRIPFFIENVYGRRAAAIDIYASTATIYAIRKYLFNNASWPDFTRLPNHLLPAVQFHELEDEVPVTLDGVRLHADPGRSSGADLRLPDRAGRRGGALVERHRPDRAPVGDRQPHAQPEGGLHRHQLRQLDAADRRRLVAPDAADPGSRARASSSATCRSCCTTSSRRASRRSSARSAQSGPATSSSSSRAGRTSSSGPAVPAFRPRSPPAELESPRAGGQES